MIRPAFQTALLAEDEAHLSRALRATLKGMGLQVRHATSVHRAREQIRQDPPDLLILERNLPDGDGLGLCRELREGGFPGAILMLTSRGETSERVEGLLAGADDYLPKPFSWEELGARIVALSRRPVAPSESLWECDPSRLRIRGPRGWTELTQLEFKLASHLISAQGAIVSRDELLKDVWGFTLLPKTRTVDHFLGRLRKRFEAIPQDPRHFLTVRGAGYRFER